MFWVSRHCQLVKLQSRRSVDLEAARVEITEKDITGLKFFDQLERLHDDGCVRDTAGNRTLHFDQYAMLLLLYFFNPIVTSLRGLQQASGREKIQKKLGCQRVSLGSLSEAATVFDPERLKEIIGELGDQLQPLAQDKRLQDIKQTITLAGWIIDCRFATHYGGFLSQSDNRQRDGEVATAYALRASSCRPHANRCDPQWRR